MDYYRAQLQEQLSNVRLFAQAPTVFFAPTVEVCPEDGTALKVLKTRTRKIRSLSIGPFAAKDTLCGCAQCHRTYRSEALDQLVPPGSNFTYGVLVHVGQALFLRHRSNQEIIAELAEKNLAISASEIDYLGKKFIAYLALAHWQRLPELKEAMALHGGYILHLDGTWEGTGPWLLSGLDSILQIVLDNAKVASEEAEQIIPFLHKIKQAYGEPIAVVKDMGAGINLAVAQVFPDCPDFICHFHFLRDVGKDLLQADYEAIRKRLRHHSTTRQLHYRLKYFKGLIDEQPGWLDRFPQGIDQQHWPAADLEAIPLLTTYSLILWILEGKKEGHGYGFPFDRPHLGFAQRLQAAAASLSQLQSIQLRGQWQDNKPYGKLLVDLQGVLKDRRLWRTVSALQEKITVFDQLREAMRLAPADGHQGLNEEGVDLPLQTIESGVRQFTEELKNRPDYSAQSGYQKMLAQIEQYWEKLFADPILVPTPKGTRSIQPQRTNNLMERFFRDFRRGYRRKRGSQGLSKTLQTMLADTPLVKNLEKPHYRQILLQGYGSLEELFAHIEIKQVRKKLAENEHDLEKIPTQIKKIIALPQLPGVIEKIARKLIAA